jgi:hypothetical protein
MKTFVDASQDVTEARFLMNLPSFDLSIPSTGFAALPLHGAGFAASFDGLCLVMSSDRIHFVV